MRKFLSLVFETVLRAAFDSIPGVVILGALGTAFAAIAPYWAHARSAESYVVYALCVYSAFLTFCFWMAILFLRDRRRRNSFHPAERTFLHLEYFGDRRNPTARKSSNVLRWYSLELGAELVMADGKPPQRITSHTVVFIMFEKPVAYSQAFVKVDFPMPSHEIKDKTVNNLIVLFSDPIPRGVVEFLLKPFEDK